MKTLERRQEINKWKRFKVLQSHGHNLIQDKM
jgi:hypothetical protein